MLKSTNFDIKHGLNEFGGNLGVTTWGQEGRKEGRKEGG